MDLSKIENFQDAVVTVMGLGLYEQGSGLGAAKWLIRHGAQTIITDLKDEEDLRESMDIVMDAYHEYREQYPDRDLYPPLFILGKHREEDFTDVQCVVQNPGVPSESEYLQAARKKNVAIESDVSLFFRYTPDPVIAVTGTKGKTTTTKMIGEMLKKWDTKTIIAGNIGVSPLEYLDEMLATPEHNPTVIELSSWMLESLPSAFKDLGRGPDIAVLTNIYPDHLNRYHSYGDYIHTKEIIFEWQSKDQFTVLNYDQDLVRQMEKEVKGRLFWCSKTYMEHDGCFVKDGMIVFRMGDDEQPIARMEDAALKGEHNAENILTSVCAAMLRGVPVAVVRDVVHEFKGVSDRQELVREVDEVTYINDTTATNPDAVIVALKHFGAEKNIVLICGGEDKGMEFEAMMDVAADTCKHIVFFPGSATKKMQPFLNNRVPSEMAQSMKEAVQKAKAAADKGTVVLLSPGAASFNMFRNEFDRGEQFREEVRNL